MDKRLDKQYDKIPNRYTKDPFPEIKPALLNSADIYDYVSVTNLIDPFSTDKMKSASYEVGFEGIIYYWDESGKKHKFDLADRTTFVLKKNSIAFLYTKTKFKLPDYIALRFNLKITHVHRGLLLGTGPLVDPGFEGHLLIPLHNLTTNDYVFKVGEGLIWVEFTKISDNKRWINDKNEIERKGRYIEFPKDKKNKGAEFYFDKAAPGISVRSSIPDAMKKTAEDARDAKNSAKILEKRSLKITVGGGALIALAVVAIAVSIYLGFQPILQMVQESIAYVQDKEDSNKKKHEELNKKITKIEKDVAPYKDLKKRIDILEKEIGELKK